MRCHGELVADVRPGDSADARDAHRGPREVIGLIPQREHGTDGLPRAIQEVRRMERYRKPDHLGQASCRTVALMNDPGRAAAGQLEA